MSPETLLQVYYAYIHSVISYGVVLWGNSTDSKRVLILQKRALRIVSGLSTKTPCRALFKFKKILTVCSLYIHDTVMNVKRNLKPFKRADDVHNFNTRNAHRLINIRRRLALCAKDPQVMGPSLYEKLPQRVKDIASVSEFQSQLKQKLLENTIYCMDEFMNV